MPSRVAAASALNRQMTQRKVTRVLRHFNVLARFALISAPHPSSPDRAILRYASSACSSADAVRLRHLVADLGHPFKDS